MIDPNCQTPPSPGSTVSSTFSPATAFLQQFSSRSSAPPDIAPDAEGARVLDYTLGKVLGRGGFSTVRAATHVKTGKVMACKIVTRDDLSDESGSAARFEDEIRIWQTLPAHPAILPLLEMKRTEYATFMIMPCLEGSLLDVLRIEGGSESTARKWFPGIVAAVSALHDGFEGFEGRMMHGDLKLDNFLVDCHGGVCVGDFGMAHIVQAGQPKRGPSPANRPSNLPSHLQVRGRLSSAPDSPRNPSRSPARRRDTLATTDINQPGHQPCPSASLPYASPELLHASPAGPSLAQDIWALGIILHALLTGRLPFNDSFDPRLQMKILRGQWEEPYVGHEWLEALHGTLNRDPLRRWDIRRVRESDAVTGWREVRTKSRSRSRARVSERGGRRTPGDSPIMAHHPDGAGRGRDRSRSRPAPHMRHDSHDERGRFLQAHGDGARSRSQSGTRKPTTPSRPGSMHRQAPPEALAAELDNMAITRGRSTQRAQRTPNSSAGSGERAPDRVGSRSPSAAGRQARPLSGAEQRRGRSRAREAAVPGTAGWWEAQIAHTRGEGTPPGSGTHSGVHSGAHTPPRDPHAGSRPPTLGFELDVVDENAPARGRSPAGGVGAARSKSRGRLDRL
jgi:serine/threonine protein kinase